VQAGRRCVLGVKESHALEHNVLASLCVIDLEMIATFNAQVVPGVCVCVGGGEGGEGGGDCMI
jgi:hypothetical protein